MKKEIKLSAMDGFSKITYLFTPENMGELPADVYFQFPVPENLIFSGMKIIRNGVATDSEAVFLEDAESALLRNDNVFEFKVENLLPREDATIMISFFSLGRTIRIELEGEFFVNGEECRDLYEDILPLPQKNHIYLDRRYALYIFTGEDFSPLDGQIIESYKKGNMLLVKYLFDFPKKFDINGKTFEFATGEIYGNNDFFNKIYSYFEIKLLESSLGDKTADEILSIKDLIQDIAMENSIPYGEVVLSVPSGYYTGEKISLLENAVPLMEKDIEAVIKKLAIFQSKSGKFIDITTTAIVVFALKKLGYKGELLRRCENFLEPFENERKDVYGAISGKILSLSEFPQLPDNEMAALIKTIL